MSVDKRLKCSNCVVCVQGTELCPLSENYDENAYLKIEEKLKRNREERNMSRKLAKHN